MLVVVGLIIRFSAPVLAHVNMSELLSESASEESKTLIVIDEESIARSEQLKQAGNALFAGENCF